MSFTTDNKNRAEPEIAVDWTRLVRRNQKISASNFGSETRHTVGFRGFPQSPQKNLRDVTNASFRTFSSSPFINRPIMTMQSELFKQR
jgi:hypothetical protein